MFKAYKEVYLLNVVHVFFFFIKSRRNSLNGESNEASGVLGIGIIKISHIGMLRRQIQV